jgi:hypothetical protein
MNRKCKHSITHIKTPDWNSFPPLTVPTIISPPFTLPTISIANYGRDRQRLPHILSRKLSRAVEDGDLRAAVLEVNEEDPPCSVQCKFFFFSFR